MAPCSDPEPHLPVFDTSIGRIGLLLYEDVRFPEASGVLAARRADVPCCARVDYHAIGHDAVRYGDLKKAQRAMTALVDAAAAA